MGLRLGAAAALTSLTTLVKYIGGTGTTLPEIMFWRLSLTAPILFTYLALRGETHRLRPASWPAHVRRSMLGLVSMAFTFGAPLLLPLAESTTLGFTAPIFAVLLSAMVLREKVGPIRWLAVALGFAGVAIIAQPGHAALPVVGAAVGLGAGFLVAVVSIVLRDLNRTNEPLCIVFWFSALSSPVMALVLPFVITHHSLTQWALLIMLGVLGCFGQLLITGSLRYGQVSSVVVMDYSALAWATLFGWLIWGDVPPLATWLGAPVIIAAGAVIAWREHLLHKRAPPAATVSSE